MAIPPYDAAPHPLLLPAWALPARFVAVMAALLALATFPKSALFSLQRIEVVGSTALAPEAVVALTGLQFGEPLFAVDAAGARGRLLADPRIRAADVRVRPPRTVSIAIAERRPIVALSLGDRFALLADDLVAVALSADAAALPELVDRTRPIPWVRPGTRVSAAGVRTALALLTALPPPLRETVARIVVSPGPDLTLVTRGGVEIRAGGADGLSDRLAQVPQVLEALRARGMRVTAIDLRYVGSVVVTPAQGASGGDAR